MPVAEQAETAGPPPAGRPRRRRLLTFAAILGPAVAILALLVFGFTTEPRYIPTPLIARPAPAFTLPLFDGGTPALGDLRGKVVVLRTGAAVYPHIEGGPKRVSSAGAAGTAGRGRRPAVGRVHRTRLRRLRGALGTAAGALVWWSLAAAGLAGSR